MSTPDIERLLSSVPTGLVDRWTGALGSSTFDVLDPSNDQVLISVANATAADAISALDAACAVQADWAATPARERGEILRSVFETIIARADDLAALMTLEMGKVVAESMGEVKYGAEFFRWFAEEAVRIGGRYIPSPAGNGRIVVTKQPVGPCYAITPWNFPLAMGTRKIGPGDGRRLHDDRQARPGDAAEHAAAGQADGRCRPARGRALGAADQPARVRSRPR